MIHLPCELDCTINGRNAYYLDSRADGGRILWSDGTLWLDYEGDRCANLGPSAVTDEAEFERSDASDEYYADLAERAKQHPVCDAAAKGEKTT